MCMSGASFSSTRLLTAMGWTKWRMLSTWLVRVPKRRSLRCVQSTHQQGHARRCATFMTRPTRIGSLGDRTRSCRSTTGVLCGIALTGRNTRKFTKTAGFEGNGQTVDGHSAAMMSVQHACEWWTVVDLFFVVPIVIDSTNAPCHHE